MIGATSGAPTVVGASEDGPGPGPGSPPARGLRIAILGTRGVPARYGGFETFAEELGARLAANGHHVTVYGRNASVPRDITSYRAMQIVRLPAPRSKYLETVAHTLFSAAHAALRRYDLVYVCNAANVPAALALRLIGKRVVLNVDGLEWQRAKWGAAGKAYYRACAWLAAHLPIQVVTDARSIQAYYRDHYGRETHFFAYGSEIDREPAADDGTLARLGIRPDEYALYVSRLEPENNALLVVDAWRRVRTDLPLVMVGDAPYADAYIARLREAAAADPRVRLAGGIYGQGYRVLRTNATLAIQATEVGGTHPALVEAMGSGRAIVANDVREHREVLDDAGLFYRGPAELAAAAQRLVDDEALRSRLGAGARQRAAEHYSWDQVASDYEAWFRSLVPESRGYHPEP